jgi:CheY-like chemotaxis protein
LERLLLYEAAIMRSSVVLVVQGDADSRLMYAEYLRAQGLDAVPVSTARQALALASTVDVIVTGLLLPGHIDGIGLIERLKADGNTCAIPLIVVTSCVWTSERARAEQAGCDVFLPKPCTPADLTREVRRLLPTRHLIG